MRRSRYKNILAAPILSRLIHRTVCLYSHTFRLNVVNEANWLTYLDNGGSVLLCAWHQQFFSAIGYFSKYRRYEPHIMISPSRDGEIIASVARHAGWHPVRGSSSRDGKKALRRLIARLKQTKLAAHIVDGPRGPMGTVKNGAIRLAHLTGAVVVPFYIFTDSAWMINSWDRFIIPRPFARVSLRFGDMITLDAARTADDFESQRRCLEQTMRPGLISSCRADRWTPPG